jgi:LytS/YehU family sensor histidine kinase
MLLQPFVENAIKHGLQNLNYPGKLSLTFTEVKDHINVEILDNGTGMQQNKTKNHNSKALGIFEQRKKGIERRSKKELTFEIQNLGDLDSAKHGVRVFLKIPILNND